MAVGFGSYSVATQIGSLTCFAQQHHAGDVVAVTARDLDGNTISGTATTNEGDVEVIWPDGTREIWASVDFFNSYQ